MRHVTYESCHTHMDAIARLSHTHTHKPAAEQIRSSTIHIDVSPRCPWSCPQDTHANMEISSRHPPTHTNAHTYIHACRRADSKRCHTYRCVPKTHTRANVSLTHTHAHGYFFKTPLHTHTHTHTPAAEQIRSGAIYMVSPQDTHTHMAMSPNHTHKYIPAQIYLQHTHTPMDISSRHPHTYTHTHIHIHTRLPPSRFEAVPTYGCVPKIHAHGYFLKTSTYTHTHTHTHTHLPPSRFEAVPYIWMCPLDPHAHMEISSRHPRTHTHTLSLSLSLSLSHTHTHTLTHTHTHLPPSRFEAVPNIWMCPQDTHANMEISSRHPRTLTHTHPHTHTHTHLPPSRFEAVPYIWMCPENANPEMTHTPHLRVAFESHTNSAQDPPRWISTAANRTEIRI